MTKDRAGAHPGERGLPRLYLASASPRRRELLAGMGIPHQVLPQDLDESARPGEAPHDYVLRLAGEKAAAAVRSLPPDNEALVLGADTAVVCDGDILGKPAGREEAFAMLERLSGRRHQVLSGVAVAGQGRLFSTLSRTEVEFRALSRGEIAAYWDSGEPADKAGGYGIQGLGGLFVKRIEGSYSAVVGLPVFETAELLSRFGWPLEVLLKGGKA